MSAYTYVNNAILNIAIQNPMLRCLYYRIPENIFATDFAFADQKNWIKPDYQHWFQDQTFNANSDNVFYVNTINQDVRSLVVLVRHLQDITSYRYDNFIGTDYVNNIYLKHGERVHRTSIQHGIRFPPQVPETQILLHKHP